MGVSNLWKLLDSASTSILLASLSGKRVAVDASIWLYQFLMAMRDSQGQILNGAHLIGFLNRILKLLFHGINPIFVFDGAVPVLKKLTIQRRRDQRNLKKSKVEQTAQKLLEKRMKLYALEGGPVVGENSQAHSLEQDEYQLPPSKRIKAVTIQDADIRMPADQELFDFIEQHKQEIDLNKVDIDSARFKALSLEKQHEIILSLKNQSRLPSLERVQQMVASSKTAKDFSLLQIKNLVHRATLTDRYHGTLKDTKKVAYTRRVEGQRQRDFILSKDEGDKSKIGWDMVAKVDDSKAVVDLTGLQGFTVNVKAPSASPHNEFADFDLERAIEASKAPDTDTNNFMFVEDGVSDEVVWNQIVAMEQKLSSAESSPAKEPVQSEVANMSREPSSIETVSISDDGSMVVEATKMEKLPEPSAASIMKSNMDSFDLVYPDINVRLSKLRSIPDFDAEIAAVEKRMGKAHEDSVISIHKRYLQLLHEMKNDFMQQSITGLFEEVVTPKRSLPAPPQKVQSSPFSIGKQKPPMFFDDDDDDEEIADVVELDSDGNVISSKHPSPSKETVEVFKPQVVEVIEIDSDEDEIEWEELSDVKSVRKEEEGSSVESPVVKLNQEDSTVSLPTSNETTIYPDEEEASEETQGDVMDVDKLAEDEASGYLGELQNVATQGISEQERQTAIQNTNQEISDLRQRHQLEMKGVGEVSTAMIEETQDLLRIFGIPFITAPMEAESQCAYLYQEKIVDGIITDDSDVFLFGGDMVYKNLFDTKKFIEKFSMEDLSAKMNLKRHHLIQMAYLLGSDYTTGLKGIGPVAAIEIVTSWPSEDLSGLTRFKNWVSNLRLGFSDPDDSPTQKKLRKICKKIEIPESFPNPSVHESYTEPAVATENLTFSFSEPRLELITSFLKRKLGWPVEKTEQKIIPVLQDMHLRKSQARQTTVDAFFVNNATPKVIKSKRVLQATGMASVGKEPKPVRGKSTSRRGKRRKEVDLGEFLD